MRIRVAGLLLLSLSSLLPAVPSRSAEGFPGAPRVRSRCMVLLGSEDGWKVQEVLNKPGCSLAVQPGDFILVVKGQDAAAIGPISMAWLLASPYENTPLRVRTGSQEREVVLPVREETDRLSQTEFLERYGIGVVIVSQEDPPRHWVVDRVVTGGPAEKAGLLKGDEVLAVDGQALVGRASPQRLFVAAHRVPARLVVRRGKQETTFDVPRIPTRELYGTPPQPPDYPLHLRNQPAPAFTAPSASGEVVSLQHYRGRWVLLNFWTVWCGPCHEEIQSLKEWAAEFGSELAIIGVNVDENAEEVKRSLQDEPLPYTVVLIGGFRETIAESYNLGGIPLNVVVNPDGWVTYVEYGFGPDSGLGAYLRTVLPASVGSSRTSGASVEPIMPLRLSRTTSRNR